MKTIKTSEMELLSRLRGELAMLCRDWREANLTVVLRFDEVGRRLERIDSRLDAIEARLDRPIAVSQGDESAVRATHPARPQRSTTTHSKRQMSTP